jgi:hypothetical protein
LTIVRFIAESAYHRAVDASKRVDPDRAREANEQTFQRLGRAWAA